MSMMNRGSHQLHRGGGTDVAGPTTARSMPEKPADVISKGIYNYKYATCTHGPLLSNHSDVLYILFAIAKYHIPGVHVGRV